MLNNSKSITIDGFELGYTIEGSGKTALVIGSAIYYPRIFSQNLRKHLKLVFMDHRGFDGANQTTDTSKFELEILLSDIEHVRSTLNLGQVIIIGHSGHGYMALEYAKKYPDNVSHVVLIGMGPDQSTASHAQAEQYFDDSVNPERKAFLHKDLEKLPEEINAHPEKRFITFCIRLGAKSWYDFTFDATPLWKDVKVNNAMFDYVWGTVLRDIDITKGIENFNKPIFLALGHFDFLVAPFFSWNSIRSKFKNLTIKLFEKSAHTPQYEEPEHFDQELIRWLKNS
jgi:proline iminopeptidase